MALLDQAPGVRRDGLEETSLGLSENGAKGERGFAGAGHPSKGDYRIPREIHVDVLQVILSGAAHAHKPHGYGMRNGCCCRGVATESVNWQMMAAAILCFIHA